MSSNNTSATNVSENVEVTDYEGVLFGKPLCEIFTLEDGSTTETVSVPMIYDPRPSDPEISDPETTDPKHERYRWENSDAQSTIRDKLGLGDSAREEDQAEKEGNIEEFEDKMVDVKEYVAKGISSILYRATETNSLGLLESGWMGRSHFEQLESKHAEHQTDPLFQDTTKVVWFEAIKVPRLPGAAAAST